MRMSSVIEASILLEDYEKAKEMVEDINFQKENISGDLLLNCSDCKNISLNTVKIEEEDAKRILQFMEDYFSKKIDGILRKIERLN